MKYFNIEIDYLTKLLDYLLDLPDGMSKIHVIDDLSDTPGKFIHHVKFYLDNRDYVEDFRDITFNEEYTKIRVEERIKYFYQHEPTSELVFTYKAIPESRDFTPLEPKQAQSIARARSIKIKKLEV